MQDVLYAVAQVYLIITTRVVWDNPLSRWHTRAGSLHLATVRLQSPYCSPRLRCTTLQWRRRSTR
jgi:hypothetical protein